MNGIQNAEGEDNHGEQYCTDSPGTGGGRPLFPGSPRGSTAADFRLAGTGSGNRRPAGEPGGTDRAEPEKYRRDPDSGRVCPDGRGENNRLYPEHERFRHRKPDL